jgi:hypothetical protein
MEDEDVFKPGTRIDEARVDNHTLDDDKQAGLGGISRLTLPETESIEMSRTSSYAV